MTTGGAVNQTILSGITYLPFGPVSGWTDGAGQQTTRTYDADYRLTSITAGAIQDGRYFYNDADNITNWDDEDDAVLDQAFTYDLLDRLTGAQGGYGALGFSYDAVDNRLTKTGDGSATYYTYANDSNRLLQTTGAEPDNYSYDSAGNLIQDNEFSYVYNQANRLAEVTQVLRLALFRG